MNVLEKFEKQNERGKIGGFRSGDTVRVHVKILEGEKERIQVFEGVVIRLRAGGNRSSFTVRKISYGVGVERIFPTHTPMIDRVDVVQRGRVRRSRLYYLRQLRGKAAKIRSKRLVPTTGTPVREEDIVPEPAESPAE